MGWSFKRSPSFGPLHRTSGEVGTNVGVKGARVGIGQRGTYVNFAAGTFRYQKLTETPRSNQRIVEHAEGNIVSASAHHLAACSPEWVLADSQQRLLRWRWFLGYCWIAGVLLLLLWASSSASTALLFALVVGAVGIPIRNWDLERRTARIIYDVDDPEVLERLAMANGAAQWLASCHTLWHVFHAVSTSDWKNNAGAGTLIRRTATRCGVGTLPQFELNVEVWCVPIGPQQLMFLPDRLLVWDGQSLAALPYEGISARASSTRFIEDGGVLPRDGHQVDSTWRFVRRDGGPDLRYNNNAQLPIMRYGELELASASGMQIVLQTSTLEASEGAAKAISALSTREASRQLNAATSQDVEPNIHLSTSSTVSPNEPGEQRALALANSVATLLRYMACADRRLDSHEVQLADEVLRLLLPHQHPALVRLSTGFRSLPVDQGSVAQALATLGATELQYRRWVVDSLSKLANADGKVTPKEVERLIEVRHALGV